MTRWSSPKDSVSNRSGRDERNDSRTLFQIGSVSKSFGAAAIGALVDDGLVAWDDPVVEHLPWFEMNDPALTPRVTVRDLLAHRSGIPEDFYPALGLVDGRAVAERSRHLSNQGEFRTAFRYSNVGYGTLGLIVEAVSGQSLDDFLQARFFRPLGMESSAASPYQVWDSQYVAPTFLGTAPAGTVTIDDAPTRNVAMPHGIDRAGARRILPWQSYDNMQAAGSVVSNAVDMAAWLRMHLAAGRLGDAVVLSPETVAELHSPQIEATTSFMFSDGSPNFYAMGWHRDGFEGREYVSHGGGIFGFPAYAAMLPELGAGVVVLANGSMWTPYYPHQEIAAWVFAQLLDLDPRDWHAESMVHTAAIMERVEVALAARSTPEVTGTQASLEAAEYTGSFEGDLGERLSVELRGDQLALQYAGAGAFSGVLEHWQDDTFRLFYDGGDGQAFSSSLATFVLGEGGKEGIEALDLGQLGRYSRVD